MCRLCFSSFVLPIPLVSASSTFFFFNDTATTEIYTLSLHDALPILRFFVDVMTGVPSIVFGLFIYITLVVTGIGGRDRKSTRLNSSHVKISYAVFCLKKKKNKNKSNNENECLNDVYPPDIIQHISCE